MNACFPGYFLVTVISILDWHVFIAIEIPI